MMKLLLIVVCLVTLAPAALADPGCPQTGAAWGEACFSSPEACLSPHLPVTVYANECVAGANVNGNLAEAVRYGFAFKQWLDCEVIGPPVC